jgi:hypothetical protein
MTFDDDDEPRLPSSPPGPIPHAEDDVRSSDEPPGPSSRSSIPQPPARAPIIDETTAAAHAVAAHELGHHLLHERACAPRSPGSAARANSSSTAA